MKIKLLNKIPNTDGYFLMKFNKNAGLHLVLIATEKDGVRVIYPEGPKTQVLTINYHLEILKDALFSEAPIDIEV